MSDMFKSMSTIFLRTIDEQLKRLETLYLKCQSEKAEISSQLNNIEHMKLSIFKMFNYVDQL